MQKWDRIIRIKLPPHVPVAEARQEGLLDDILRRLAPTFSTPAKNLHHVLHRGQGESFRAWRAGTL